jgi:hypothetical protein
MFFTSRRLALTLALAAGALIIGAGHQEASAASKKNARAFTVLDRDRGQVLHHDNDPRDDRLCVVRRVPVMDPFTGDVRIVPKMRCVRGF